MPALLRSHVARRSALRKSDHALREAQNSSTAAARCTSVSGALRLARVYMPEPPNSDILWDRVAPFQRIHCRACPQLAPACCCSVSRSMCTGWPSQVTGEQVRIELWSDLLQTRLFDPQHRT